MILAPPVTGRPDRERSHDAALARRLAGVSGASPEGRELDQLNVPGSETTGIEAGADITAPPSSQHGAGAQAGAHGSQAGIPHGSPCRRHGERNSMND